MHEERLDCSGLSDLLGWLNEIKWEKTGMDWNANGGHVMVSLHCDISTWDTTLEVTEVGQSVANNVYDQHGHFIGNGVDA